HLRPVGLSPPPEGNTWSCAGRRAGPTTGTNLMLAAPTTLALGASWRGPQWLISTFGLIGILAIVFAESGLLVGFFLPGDSLLFTAGLLIAGGTYLPLPLWGGG